MPEEEARKAFAGEEEASWLYEVLAFDPGGTTGWALIGVHPDALSGDPDVRIVNNVVFWSAGELKGNQDDQADEAVGLIDAWPSARLVTEDFKVRQLNAELSPVEVNAILRNRVRPRYFVKQNSQFAMKTITDDRQKAMGFWLPGKEHARDAIKHALTFLKTRKERAVEAARRERRNG